MTETIILMFAVAAWIVTVIGSLVLIKGVKDRYLAKK